MIPVSTGTNNVFPRFVEATVAGEAAGLVAAGHVALDEVGRRRPRWSRWRSSTPRASPTPHDLALVDAVLLDEPMVGSRALFDPARLRTVVLCRAEPAAVGAVLRGRAGAPLRCR